MGMNCGCPAAKHLEDLEIPQCAESLGQIQKVFIQRVFSAPGVKNFIADVTTKASWTDLLTAGDSTKVIVSPYVEGPTSEPGAARTYGGGNASLGGIEKVVGREPTTFTSMLYEQPQSVIKTLKKYMCEEIGVYLIDEYGRIGCLSSGPGSYMPIPIRKFFVGDKKLGGLEEDDSNVMEWSFLPNWSDDLVIAQPKDFNPLTDLANQESV